MTTSRRHFTVQEKLAILEEADQIGSAPTIRKHNLSYNVFLRWRNQFIEKLKETIAQQALKLKAKKELRNTDLFDLTFNPLIYSNKKASNVGSKLLHKICTA